jgi:hypothetical protein
MDNGEKATRCKKFYSTDLGGKKLFFGKSLNFRDLPIFVERLQRVAFSQVSML